MARTAPDAPRPTAAAVLDDAVRALAPDSAANRLVSQIEAGAAPRSVFATFALEQHQVIAADRVSFQHLARRADGDPPVADFFDLLAQGETRALKRLAGLADACGLSEREITEYQPRPGCQAYPSYAARLALSGEPADVAIALTANFASWGGCCAIVAAAMRDHYGFPEAARGFFAFFAEPAPAVDEKAREAVQHGLDTGQAQPATAHRYGRLLQSYELMFWDSVAE
ncbi:transcriptional regulator [Streptomyces sp. Je 1-4]|uniref:transcriptional regulator n=1 Tax=Streptomyces TaxID=1883 RepID=UPI0021D85AEE|nr:MULTISPECIES: transcriptional regulator [unclassified Streptomyces]UYB39163.1 transcriptional regulator [Streptomyces sp. Je 1-4]UZQ35174.1 transcriptional regulator [Streptomyces sp. Je 1-4] [Streptomyces sp. Je 1-4 4N24]UZQ42592.1 transcriptional regulator [Streptomyces sp. Je 1-4] [Streptomyces sp. Je 1-4 4N24_ara]